MKQIARREVLKLIGSAAFVAGAGVSVSAAAEAISSPSIGLGYLRMTDKTNPARFKLYRLIEPKNHEAMATIFSPELEFICGCGDNFRDGDEIQIDVQSFSNKSMVLHSI